MAKTTPTVKDDILILWDHELDREIVRLEVDSPHWLACLDSEATKRFRYIAEVGTFTAIQEAREVGRSRSGHKVYTSRLWFGHRRASGKLRRAYLGKNEKLTQAKLQEVAPRLA